jgi:hypothetical protein
MSQTEWVRFFEGHLTEGVVALLVLAVLVAIRNGRRNWERLREEQSRRHAVAASLGFSVPGSRDAPLDRMFASLADAREKLGPFPRFSELHERVEVQFEGERRGMKTIVALHTLDSETTPPNRSTLACFASPEIQVSEFELTPAEKPLSPEVEAVFNGIEKALKFVGWLNKVPPIQFPGRTFNQLYTLDSNFSVSIRDDFDEKVLDFFERSPGWRVQGLKGRLLVWREGVVVAPEGVAAFLSEAAEVAQVFRRPVRRDA